VLKYVHANYRYGVNCGSKIKYSRYRQTLAAHGRQSSDTGYSFSSNLQNQTISKCICYSLEVFIENYKYSMHSLAYC
jgi:hypothetical protein